MFLTTVKPLQKVVTAQDIQSCLYYIHVDNDGDERLRKSIDSAQADKPETLTPAKGVPPGETGSGPQRRPPGDVPNDFPGHGLIDTPKVRPHYKMPLAEPSKVMQVARKPVGSNLQSDIEAPRTMPKLPTSRIMGPRAMNPRLHSDSQGLSVSHGKENMMPRRWSEQLAMRQPSSFLQQEASRKGQDLTNSRRTDDLRYDTTSLSPLDRETVLSHRSSYQQHLIDSEIDGFSLTLIRRYDGSQWNVGKIFEMCDPSNLCENPPVNRQNDLSIQINTPDYVKFCAPRTPADSAAPDPVFTCRLSRLRRRSQGSGLAENTANVTNSRKSRMSIDFRRPSKSSLEPSSKKAKSSRTSPENSSTSIKGYGFYSPWGGTCQFVPGISGHALKCKHTAPSEGSHPVTVSELRFNLPAPSKARSVSPKDLKTSVRPKNMKRWSQFASGQGSSMPLIKSENAELDDGDESINLSSLGQEHAGGGFGGKQAKLGKLIIEPEGLKMLDLLVAANMSLWWKVYEKSA